MLASRQIGAVLAALFCSFAVAPDTHAQTPTPTPNNTNLLFCPQINDGSPGSFGSGVLVRDGTTTSPARIAVANPLFRQASAPTQRPGAVSLYDINPVSGCSGFSTQIIANAPGIGLGNFDNLGTAVARWRVSVGGPATDLIAVGASAPSDGAPTNPLRLLPYVALFTTSGTPFQVGSSNQLTEQSLVSPNLSLFGDAMITGDINNDGFEDLIVGIPGSGHVNVYSGNLSGGVSKLAGPQGSFAPSISVDDYTGLLPPSLPYTSIKVGNSVGLFGASLAIITVNGNKAVVVGAPRGGDFGTSQLNGGGCIAAFGWNASLGRLEILPNLVHCEPKDTSTGPLPTSSEFGFAVAAIGDVDLDGIEDLAVGAPLFDVASGSVPGLVNVGKAHVVSLGNLGTPGAFLPEDLAGVQPGEKVGFSIASAPTTVRVFAGGPTPVPTAAMVLAVGAPTFSVPNASPAPLNEIGRAFSFHFVPSAPQPLPTPRGLLSFHGFGGENDDRFGEFINLFQTVNPVGVPGGDALPELLIAATRSGANPQPTSIARIFNGAQVSTNRVTGGVRGLPLSVDCPPNPAPTSAPLAPPTLAIVSLSATGSGAPAINKRLVMRITNVPTTGSHSGFVAFGTRSAVAVNVPNTSCPHNIYGPVLLGPIAQVPGQGYIDITFDVPNVPLLTQIDDLITIIGGYAPTTATSNNQIWFTPQQLITFGLQ